MSHDTSRVSRFIRAVHRRFVVVRALERSGLFALIGCALALLLLPILMWRHEPGLTLAIVCVSLSAVVGLAWGVLRRPTLLDAAMEADRQLKLHDLLGTALSCADDADEWQQSVLAVAVARCGSLHPSAVMVKRLSPRGWGGIALATVAVLTLGVISSDTPGPSAPAAAAATTEAQRAQDTQPWPAAHTSRQPHHDQRLNDPRTLFARAGKADHPSMDEGSDEASGSAARAQAGRASGAGGGTSESPRAHAQPHGPAAGDAQHPQAHRSGDTVGGGGISQDQFGRVEEPSSGGAGGASVAARRSPPWHSQSWPQDRAAALSAVHAGQIPGPYRDLVREYFQRP